jgi:hypothetical protein
MAPDAFIGMMSGKNVGKALVQTVSKLPFRLRLLAGLRKLLPGSFKRALARRVMTREVFLAASKV